MVWRNPSLHIVFQRPTEGPKLHHTVFLLMNKFCTIFFFSMRKISTYHLPSYAVFMKTLLPKCLLDDYHRQGGSKCFEVIFQSIEAFLLKYTHKGCFVLFVCFLLLLIVTTMVRMIACQDYSPLAEAHCSKTEGAYAPHIQSGSTFCTVGF